MVFFYDLVIVYVLCRDPQFVVCVNTVVGQVIGFARIEEFSDCQLLVFTSPIFFPNSVMPTL